MIYLISLIIAPLWAFPVLTASYARHLGRPYKKWLILGIVFPIISLIVLNFLPDLSEETVEKK